MRNVVIISPCVKCHLKSDFYLSEFHFSGFYKGHSLKSLRITSKQKFEVGEEYVMYVLVEKVWSHILYGNLLKSKKIGNLRASL